MVYTGSSDDLVARISYSLTKAVDGARPLAFLTGSGVSRGAVPMSGQIVSRIRKSITEDDDVAAFDAHLAGASDDGERYQQAFQWLGVPGHEVGDTRLIGGRPPQAVCARA